MTYRDLVSKLREAGSSEPQNEAVLLLEAFFGSSLSDTILFPNNDYPSSVLVSAINRRASGEPIQYIIGKVFFFNCEIKVSPACLIPRAETELLCKKVIELLPANGHFLELCTGSGCIPIAVLKERVDTTCESIELYPETAALALENQKLNDISSDKLTILCSDALDYPINDHLGTFDAIVSNPPYIRTDEMNTLSKEVLQEPLAALDGGPDGMLFYRKFLSFYAPMLKPDGFFAFEIGYNQAKDISDICCQLDFECKIHKDYSGNDRIVVIRPKVAKRASGIYC